MFRNMFLGLLLAGFMSPLASLPAMANDHKFTVDNKGGHQVDHLYLSPISSRKWGRDQLGPNEVLPPAHHISFQINTDCELDVRVVYHDGTVHIDKDVDTCKYNLTLNY